MQMRFFLIKVMSSNTFLASINKISQRFIYLFLFLFFSHTTSNNCEENRKTDEKVARWHCQILKNNHSGTETHYFEDSEELG